MSIHLFSGKQGYKTNEKAALLANVSDLHLVHADLDLDPYPAQNINVDPEPDPGCQ